MAKYSMKRGGKEVGPADVYAPPHTMTGKAVNAADSENGYRKEPTKANRVNMSVGNINRDGYNPEPKTSGIVVRGGKAQTKGKMARGPMA